MFRQVRYQTGELNDIVNEMKNKNVPCLEVDDIDEFNWVLNELEKYDIYIVRNLPYDKNARNKVDEPEFEFRVAFHTKPEKSSEMSSNDLLYLDVYFEPFIEETYDSVGEM